jgi:hypothetical protein
MREVTRDATSLRSRLTEHVALKTFWEMAAAIDRALPLCEAVVREPSDPGARRALTLELAALADPSTLELCQRAKAETRGLCSFAHILAKIMRDCMTQSDTPDRFMQFMIGSKARDLLALLPELKNALNVHSGRSP